MLESSMGEARTSSRAVQIAAENRLEALTGLRFLAAAHVLFFHAGVVQLPGVPEWIRNMAGHADLSVSLFFVLSGFILTYNYYDPDCGCRVSDRQFWAARIARVYPVYLLGLLLALPLLLADLAADDLGLSIAKVAAIVLVLCLVQSWLPETAWFWNFPSWSLSDEAFFYWCFPWSMRRLRSWTRGQLALGMVAIWLIAQAPPVIAQTLGPEGAQLVDTAAMPRLTRVVQMNPLLRLPDFVFGILLGQLYLLESAAGRSSQRRFQRWGAALAITGLGLLIVAVSVRPEYPFPLTLSRSLTAPLNGLLIFGLALGGGPLWVLLSSRFMVLLGNASYALYLLHIPVIYWTYTAARAWFGAESPISWALLVADVIVAIGVSVLAYLLVEEPMRRVLRQRLMRTFAARGADEPSNRRGA
jgi:peptidoglycan/LPS O-acetylase OafA/YrhL